MPSKLARGQGGRVRVALCDASRDAPCVTREEHRERLARIARSTDYPWTIVAINPVNRLLVGPAAKLGISPNVVTFLSFGIGLCAAAMLALAVLRDPLGLVLAPVLVYVAHLLDALDGDLARYTGKTSKFGELIDPALDRAREVAYAAAIAFAAAELGHEDAWLAGLLCVAATQNYYYVADAQVTRLLGSESHDVARHDVVGGSVGKTRIKFGLYEPYMYGLALGAVAGVGYEALWAFAATFGAGWVWQLVKLRRKARS